MQIGIVTVGDVTPDPTNGTKPTEHDRIKTMVEIAKHAEDVGLDVFATGEHHNPPFVPTLTFREYFGDYQRQLFLMDHAGLPLKTVLEQLDLLGSEVVPTLRKEFTARKPAHVPKAPTFESRKAKREKQQQSLS